MMDVTLGRAAVLLALLFLAVLAGTTNAAPSCPGLVPLGYTVMHTFDNTLRNVGSGGKAFDAVLVGAEFLDEEETALSGPSVRLAGQQSFVLLGGRPQLGPGGWTLALWFRGLLSSASYRTLFRGETTHPLLADIGTDMLGSFNVGHATCQGDAILAAGGIGGVVGFNQFGQAILPGNDNMWHQLTVVGLGNNSGSAVYLDGTAMGKSPYFPQDVVLALGNFQMGGQQFSEEIDEFVQYPFALSAAQVQLLFNSYNTSGDSAGCVGPTGSSPSPSDQKAAASLTAINANVVATPVSFKVRTTSSSSSGSSSAGQTQTTTPAAVGLQIQLFQTISEVASHPEAVLDIDPSFRILGGGIQVNWQGIGNMATAAWPESGTRWHVQAKDHGVGSPASVMAFAVGARLSNGVSISDDDYIIVNATSNLVENPEARVQLPEGYVLVGGGAIDTYVEPGNLLWASYPQGNSWVAAGKSHLYDVSASVTVYAIGLSTRFLLQHGLHVVQTSSSSSNGDMQPNHACRLPAPYIVTGGGARANWSGAGSLLTVSRPLDAHSWAAASKQHMENDLATITAFCIGIAQK